tara:strand:+ start:174 stop:455 length:282 start_codon:yes stop_codon:yes gene_type:complete
LFFRQAAAVGFLAAATTIKTSEEVVMPNNITNLSDSDLQQRRANARVTAANSLGHGKSHWNTVRVEEFEVELKRRGIDIDTSIEGQFNGPGSY